MTLVIRVYATGDLSDSRYRAALEKWREDDADDPFDIIANAGGDSESEAVAALRLREPRAVGVEVQR